MANGLPTLRDDVAPFGESVTPTGQLPPIDPFDVADVGSRQPFELDAIAAPEFGTTPELIGIDPIAPDLRQPELPAFEVAAPEAAAAEPLEFAPEPVSPRAELAAGLSPRFEELQINVADLSSQQDALHTRADELATLLGTQTDPAERRATEQQAADNIAATARNNERLAESRGVRDRVQATETARLGDSISQQERRTQLDIRETQLAAEREAQLDDAARAEAGRQAQQELSDARERHAQIIERGPSRPAFATTAVAMITEALKPLTRPDGTSDYGAVVDRLMRDAGAQHAREIEAARLRTQISGDDIGNMARERKESAIQKSVIREMTARTLMLETDKLVAGAQDEFQRARGLSISDDLKRIQAEESAKQQALAQDRQRKAALDDQKFRKGEADIALTGAKISKEQQAAIKTAAEAAKLSRRGGGRGRAKVDTSSLFGAQIGRAVSAGQLDEKGAKLVFGQGVIDPVSGELTTRADGSFVLATTPKVAAELNATGARVARVNSLVNEAMAIRGAKGWEPTGKWLASDAGKRMEAISTELLFINKDIFKLGVLSGDDVTLLEAVQGGSLTGLKDPRPTMADMQRRMIAAYNQERKSLAPGSQSLGFTKVQAAPARSLSDVDTLLNQAPNLRTGDVPDVGERLSAADEKFELLVEQNSGDIRAASEQFTADTTDTLKRAEAHRLEIDAAYEAELPENWNELTRAGLAAAFAAAQLPGTATGAEINAAEALAKRTRRAAENALSRKAKRLRTAGEDQAEFIDELGRKAGGELERQAEARALDEQRKVAAEREIQLSKLPTAGKI